MCGIAGIVGFKPLPDTVSNYLSKMECAIQHRGPDGSGHHVRKNDGFLNVRLAIVDREGGSQPIYNSDRSVGIVYNGEVYNFPELREELIAKGFEFHTTSDTEVILQLYLAEGVESFKRLNGMFAFCIWDERIDALYIVRDQLGIKPLYFYKDEEKLVFASELKAILSVPAIDKTLDEKGIFDYFTFRYTQAPFTVFSKISRLEAGTYIKIQGSKFSRYTYWDVSYTDGDASLDKYSADDLKVMAREKLLSAVKSQLMGEVPIGVLLSGGVDSSAIAWCIHSLGADLTTYNIGFPEVNEFEFSREVAHEFGLKHVEVCMATEDLLKDFDVTVRSLDEPIADPACFPLYQLCKELKKKVTVVLSGEGGDELFGGYPQYIRMLQNPAATPEQQFDSYLDASYYFRNLEPYFQNKQIPPHFLRWRKYFLENHGLNGMLAYDMRTWMPDNLMMKADKILMAHSLEGRFPFLDQELMRFTSLLKTSQKISPDWTTKWLLKESFKDILPESVTGRPKMGFSVPVDSLLRQLKDRVLGATAEFKDHQLGEILDLSVIQRFFEAFFAGQHNSALQVWTMFIFLDWFSKNK